MKSDGQAEGNETKRQSAKIFLNSIYGKFLQHIMDSIQAIIRTYEELETFMLKTDLLDLLPIFEDAILASGAVLDIETQLTYPSYYGAFVLSISKRLMNRIVRLNDPSYLDDPVKSMQNCYYYGDTDSLMVEIRSQADEDKFEDVLGSNQLGKLNNDYKNDEKVIQAEFLAPKSYRLTLIDKDNKIYDVMKCKGIPSKHLKAEHFEKLLKDPNYYESYDKSKSSDGKHGIEFLMKHRLKKTADKKIWVETDKNDESQDYCHDPFTIYSQDMTRTFMKNQWTGRNFDLDENSSSLDGFSVPHGFDEDSLDQIIQDAREKSN